MMSPKRKEPIQVIIGPVILFFSVQLISASAFAQVEYVECRNSFQNCRIRFEREKTGHVAFMGGSITEMNGYRPMVTTFLKKRFPETHFQFTDAGISSTCSTAGAFRLQHDVLSKGQVDLFFIEFAVNDDQDAAHSYENAVRGMEGIIRQVRRHSPLADIVVTYFVNPGMMEKLQQGKTPTSIAAHEAVAKHYGVTTVLLAHRVAQEIQDGTLTWEKYGGVHPAPFGNAIPASMIEELLTNLWTQALSDRVERVVHRLPEKMLDSHCYEFGHYLSVEAISLSGGWSLGEPDWKSIKGQIRGRHQSLKVFSSESPGDLLTFKFTGTAFGLECLAGPDAGTIEYSVDESPWEEFNLSHRFSKGLHYPRTVVLKHDLLAKIHTVRIRLTDAESDHGYPPAVRILNVVINGQ